MPIRKRCILVVGEGEEIFESLVAEQSGHVLNVEVEPLVIVRLRAQLELQQHDHIGQDHAADRHEVGRVHVEHLAGPGDQFNSKTFAIVSV